MENVYEIIGGKNFPFPSETPIEDQIRWRIIVSLAKYFMATKNGYVYGHVDVYFDDENIFVPDLSVVMKEREQIIAQGDMIRGAPNMVVEVLSRSTRKRDLTVKKDTYEAYGVREYWIVDPWAKSVDVYLLRDGKYEFDDEYIFFDKQDLEYMTDDEKANIKHEVPVSTLDGLKIPLNYIFKWGY